MSKDAPDGSLLLLRTGPFVPPISEPNFTVVVKDSVRLAMQSENLTGFVFAPVVKHRIVHLDWRRWDLAAEEPPEFPETGEPEDYILRGAHSAATGVEMGDLWELRPPPIPGLQISGGSNYDPAKYNGQDICKMQRLGGHIYVSQRLRDWLMEKNSEWVTFQPAFPVTAA
jgi:hypothetical protein